MTPRKDEGFKNKTMQLEAEVFEKQDMFSDEMRTMILFNATMTSATLIKDTGMRHNAKKWLELWYKTGTKMWKEIKVATSGKENALEAYEELSTYVNEVVRIALNKTDYNGFLKEIQ